MKVLKKIFGGIEMTWIKVIIFSVATAVVTAALLLIPAFKDSPLRNMGVHEHWWIIFAVFVVSNCKKPLEAGLKCFVFFLVSQPLIYLIQQPFASVNLIQEYYLKWFIITLLTFPGGIIAFQIKRKDTWSALILAVAGVFLGVSGIGEVIYAIFDRKPSGVVDGLFFMAVAILFGFIFCSGKKLKVYMAIILTGMIGFGGYTVYSNISSVPTEYEYDIPYEGTWQLQNNTLSEITVDFADKDTLKIEHGKKGSGDIVVVNEKGDAIHYIINVNDNEVTVIESE